MLKAAVLQAFLDVSGVISAHSRALLATSNINLTIKTMNIIQRLLLSLRKKSQTVSAEKNCMM